MNAPFDCIVVGSGPSGSSAAIRLAELGHSVLIIEKASLPRYKPCGGGVSPQVQGWFDFDFSPVVSLQLRHAKYTWRMEEDVDIAFDDAHPIWMVRRETFDAFLVERAVEKGAEIEDGTAVTAVRSIGDHWEVEAGDHRWRARYLIAADGSKGPMAGMLGFKKRRRTVFGALEAEAKLDVDPQMPIHFEFGMVKGGYLWNFPKADGFSLGIGKSRDVRGVDMREVLAEYCRSFGVELEETPSFGHPIGAWGGDQRLDVERAVLAGEAACLVDPFTAEGIRPSIRSGLLAAEAIDRALAGESRALRDYSSTVASEIGREMRWAKRIGSLFYRFPRVGWEHGASHPRASHVFAKIFAGELEYSDVAGRAVRRLAGALGR